MRVEQSRHIDASEPDSDGMYDWYYEYDIYRFVEGERVLIAQSYIDSSTEAHLLRFEDRGNHRFPTDYLEDPLLKEAAHYLRGIGKSELQCLGPGGYVRLSPEA